MNAKRCWLKRIFKLLDRKCIVKTCSNPRWLLVDLREEYDAYDLFLVDIEMGGVRGFDFIY